ncbi:MAG: ABC transporter substrate-binding protein [Methanoregula sp.]|nr:MAG: ABC transporter substrate-binding protein [Methanoregula sp.]
MKLNLITILFVIGSIAVFAAGCTMAGTGSPAGAVPPVLPLTPSSTTAPAAAVHPGSACTPVTITQTDGKQVTLPCRPRRIIVANAGAAEMLIAFGVGDRIVGVTEAIRNVSYIMDKIPQAENIGNWQTPNVEQILALRPDILLTYSSYKPRNLDQLAAANITVLSLDCYRLSTLASDARELGKLTGTSNRAEIYARMVEDTIATVDAKVRAIPSDNYPTVYFESYTDYTAAAYGSGSDEMLTATGGINIAGDAVSSSMRVSPEWVIARQPQYVMKVVSSTNTRPFAEIVSAMKERPGWYMIPAVRENRVYAFANEIEYGPRAYIGLVWTAQLLHPEDFRDMHPRSMLNDYEQRYVSGTNRTMVIYP